MTRTTIKPRVDSVQDWSRRHPRHFGPNDRLTGRETGAALAMLTAAALVCVWVAL